MRFGFNGENFPYTNFHDLNLDWILKNMKELSEKVDIASTAKITVADPVQWNSGTSYPPFTMVTWNDGAYISKQDVPAGTAITNTDYWLNMFDMSQVFESLKEACATADDGLNTTSSANRETGSLVWLNDQLHVVTADITAGDTYTSSNVEPISLEEWVLDLIGSIEPGMTGARQFILIGDSFGGGVDGNDNAHAVPGGGWIQRFKDAVTGWAEVYNNQTPLSGAYGFASSRPFLDVLQDAEQYVPDKTKITDIVVLGGTNDRGISASSVRSAIETFVAYCHTNYPQARVAIGCISTAVSDMIATMGPIYQHCVTKGAEYIADLRGLFCIKKYIGTDGVHLTQAGYEFYQKYITQAILTGYSDWFFSEESAEDWLTIDSGFGSSANPVRFSYSVSNKSWSMGIMGTNASPSFGIANIIPANYASSSDALITTQNTLQVFAPYSRNQIVYCEGKTVAETYMTANGNIYIKRPFGLSQTANAFSFTGCKTYNY